MPAAPRSASLYAYPEKTIRLDKPPELINMSTPARLATASGRFAPYYRGERGKHALCLSQRGNGNSIGPRELISRAWNSRLPACFANFGPTRPSLPSRHRDKVPASILSPALGHLPLGMSRSTFSVPLLANCTNSFAAVPQLSTLISTRDREPAWMKGARNGRV